MDCGAGTLVHVGNGTKCACDENWTWIGILSTCTVEPETACTIFVPWAKVFEIFGSLIGLLPGVLLVRAWAAQRANRGNRARKEQRQAEIRPKKCKEARGKSRADAPEHIENREVTMSQLSSVPSTASVLGENPLEVLPGCGHTSHGEQEEKQQGDRGSNCFYTCMSRLCCFSMADEIPLGADGLIILYSVANLGILLSRLFNPESHPLVQMDFKYFISMIVILRHIIFWITLPILLRQDVNFLQLQGGIKKEEGVLHVIQFTCCIMRLNLLALLLSFVYYDLANEKRPAVDVIVFIFVAILGICCAWIMGILRYLRANMATLVKETERTELILKAIAQRIGSTVYEEGNARLLFIRRGLVRLKGLSFVNILAVIGTGGLCLLFYPLKLHSRFAMIYPCFIIAEATLISIHILMHRTMGQDGSEQEGYQETSVASTAAASGVPKPYNPELTLEKERGAQPNPSGTFSLIGADGQIISKSTDYLTQEEKERNYGLAPCSNLYLCGGVLSGSRFLPTRKRNSNQSFERRCVKAYTPKPGSYPFVRLPNEKFIRAGVRPFKFGEACGHGLLADSRFVLAAGEVEVAEGGRLIRWNNLSGTYQPPKHLVGQAGLPLEFLYLFLPDLELGETEGGGGDTVRVPGGVMRRIINVAQYEEARIRVADYLKAKQAIERGLSNETRLTEIATKLSHLKDIVKNLTESETFLQELKQTKKDLSFDENFLLESVRPDLDLQIHLNTARPSADPVPATVGLARSIAPSIAPITHENNCE